MEDVERVLQLPVVGYIAQIQYDSDEESIYVTRQPRSPVSEAFRLLRTNLEFAGVDHPIRRLLVTSAGPGEGKTTITVNLAAIIAQGGKRVTIVDADLRRPKVHRFLGLSNKVGLSDLFRGVNSNRLVSQMVDDLGTISVLTSGSLPPNPAELLGSVRMEQILEEAEQEADVVIIDCPPSLVADVQVLAGRVDGVLMVIQPARTQSDAALATLEMLNRAGARTIGVVLNRIPRDRADYYGGYRHYSPYYAGYSYYSYSSRDAGQSRKSSHMRRLFRKISPFNNNGHKKSVEGELEEAKNKKH
jgi:non-specific protein-tyrosine kinase